ncbi:hypothetical protein C8Q76DRAFT_797460 [Earliella scabrosa]|nr:hypothetical protein C8Q76DRAFT_797460 [Earliella scabrosa]
MSASPDASVSATVAAVQKAVNRWKFQSFRKGDTPYASAVYSLGTQSPLVEVKQTGAMEWTVCEVGTMTPAVLSHASIFADADDYYTGNLVVGKGPAPPNLEPSSAIAYASYRCSYSYAFDTQADSDLYFLQTELEKYVECIPGFKPRENLPRRNWQRGGSGFANTIYWMKTPMFLRHPKGLQKPPFPSHLHEWVRRAEEGSRKYRANPDRPVVRAIEDGRLKPISACAPPELREGDGVAMTFTLKYLIGEVDWYPQYLLIDLVRVAVGVGQPPRLAGATYGSVTGSLARSALEDGEVVDAEAAKAADRTPAAEEPSTPLVAGQHTGVREFSPEWGPMDRGLEASPEAGAETGEEERRADEEGSRDRESSMDVDVRDDRAADAPGGEFVVLEAPADEGRAEHAGSTSSSAMEVLIDFEAEEEEGRFSVGGDGAVQGKKVLTQKLRAALSRSGPRGTRKPRGGRGRA